MSSLSAFLPTAGGWRASELTRGPWDPGHQHAGPPSALVAREVLRAAAPLGLTHLARLTANLLRPIPIAELQVAVATDYAGRNAAHFSATVAAEGKEVMRCTALVQREVPLPLPEGLAGHPLPRAPRSPQESLPGRFPFHSDERVGYSQLVETRVATGHMFRGPCAIWFRLRHPIVEGETPMPAERVAVAADSGNGISAILDFRKYLFVNTDLTINLLRPPRGEWVCIEAQTLFGPDSSGLAESRIYDEEGLIGRGTQSLVVRSR
ncbi:MAG: thioesterase family protein [Betaproteobacteria bacterium]|nr:thioesterase family protein [Betaproteobacteria bacterium]MDH5220312.1 thioesterase family protein [Betaproteobacteria bacterium]MDH5351005.1 thioesterase family protein [Betaproteobacteria bacterium]